MSGTYELGFADLITVPPFPAAAASRARSRTDDARARGRVASSLMDVVLIALPNCWQAETDV
jgi:hypothetical protein